MARPEVRVLRPGCVGLAAAMVQGACALLMVANSGKLLLGLGSAVAVSGAQSLVHNDAVRYSLMLVAGAASALTFYVLWNGRRLRMRPASAWRRLPMTRRQRWSLRIAFISATLSWVLIAGELVAHQILHP